MLVNKGWIDPSQPIKQVKPNCIKTMQSKFLGIHKITEKAYLFTNQDNTTGTWIPKSMCYGIHFNADQSVEVTHPVYADCNQTKLEYQHE